MSDAIDERLKKAVDGGLAAGLSAAEAATSALGDEVGGVAFGAATFALHEFRRYVFKALEGSGRVDVSGDVDVDVKIHD